MAAIYPAWLPSALPTGAQLVTDALPNVFTSPLRAVRALREIGRTAVRLARCAVDGATGPLSIPAGAPSAFETPVGARRVVSFARLSLGQVQSLRERFGVTVNDVVLAVCSGALRTHLAEHDQEHGGTRWWRWCRSRCAGSPTTSPWATGSRPCSSR